MTPWLLLLVSGCGRLGYDVSSDTDAQPDVGPFRADSMSVNHALGCAIAEGRLFCWGANDVGQVGTDETSAPVLSPRRIGADTDWRSIAVGSSHACALKEDSSLWCWGANTVGALGLGEVTRAGPTQLSAPQPTSWTSLSAGWDHNCAITSAGQLWCWGENDEGQLGQLDDQSAPGISRTQPTRLGSELDWVMVSGGQGHTCGLRGDSLFCWGRNTQGQLALGDGALEQIRLPTEVSSGWNLVDVSQGTGCGIRNDQSLWCWSSGSSGQLGQGNTQSSTMAIQVGDQSDWQSLSVSTFHVCGIRDVGEMWCWGRSIEGQHGNGITDDVLLPVATAVGQQWKAVEVSRFGTCGIDFNDVMWCSGENAVGQLGIGSTDRPNMFTALQFL